MRYSGRFAFILFYALIGMIFFSFSGYSQILPNNSKPYLLPFDQKNAPEFVDFIRSETKDKSIVGLGEVSHFTKECYDFKTVIIETLIEEGFDGLILEVDFGQALIWNQYLREGIGNLDSIVAQSGWFTYRTEEFKHLLSKIREHNLEAEKPFQLFGMEMTAQNHNIDWLIHYFENIFKTPTYIFDLLNAERPSIAFQNHDPKQVIDYWNLHHQIRAYLLEEQALLIEARGQAEYDIALQITEIFRQYATYVGQDDFGLKSEFRDQFSARNVYWAMQQLGDSSQLIIWAHNGHVAKTSPRANYDVLGHYLDQWFGEDYYSIGFTFNSGAVGAYSNSGFQVNTFEAMTEPSITKELSDRKHAFILFDLRSYLRSDKSINNPLRGPQLIRVDVSESFQEGWSKSMEINLSACYDALIYLDEIRIPKEIEWIR